MGVSDAAPILGLFIPPVSVGLALLIGVPVVMIWVFAFVPWPAIDTKHEVADGPGYDPPARALQGPVQAIHAAERGGQPQGRGITRRPNRRRDDE